MRQIGVAKVRIIKICTLKICALQVGARKIRALEIKPRQVCATEVGAAKVCTRLDLVAPHDGDTGRQLTLTNRLDARGCLDCDR